MKTHNPLYYLACLLCLLSLTSFGSNKTQGGDEIPLHDGTLPGNIPHSQTQVPISCYLMSSVNTVLVSSSSITTSAHVEIENTDSGLTIAQDIQISSVPTSIILPGPGHYIIEIYLPSGTMYFGSFNYQ